MIYRHPQSHRPAHRPDHTRRPTPPPRPPQHRHRAEPAGPTLKNGDPRSPGLVRLDPVGLGPAVFLRQRKVQRHAGNPHRRHHAPLSDRSGLSPRRLRRLPVPGQLQPPPPGPARVRRPARRGSAERGRGGRRPVGIPQPEPRGWPLPTARCPGAGPADQPQPPPRVPDHRGIGAPARPLGYHHPAIRPGSWSRRRSWPILDTTRPRSVWASITPRHSPGLPSHGPSICSGGPKPPRSP